MSTLDALVEHSLTLVCASHLTGHVIHLLRITLWAILVHYDFFHTLVSLGSLFGCLHPLFPLIEFFSGDNFVADKVSNVGHVLAETAFRGRGVRSQGEQHATVAAEDG